MNSASATAVTNGWTHQRSVRRVRAVIAARRGAVPPLPRPGVTAPDPRGAVVVTAPRSLGSGVRGHVSRHRRPRKPPFRPAPATSSPPGHRASPPAVAEERSRPRTSRSRKPYRPDTDTHRGPGRQPGAPEASGRGAESGRRRKVALRVVVGAVVVCRFAGPVGVEPRRGLGGGDAVGTLRGHPQGWLRGQRRGGAGPLRIDVA